MNATIVRSAHTLLHSDFDLLYTSPTGLLIHLSKADSISCSSNRLRHVEIIKPSLLCDWFRKGHNV